MNPNPLTDSPLQTIAEAYDRNADKYDDFIENI